MGITLEGPMRSIPARALLGFGPEQGLGGELEPLVETLLLMQGARDQKARYLLG